MTQTVRSPPWICGTRPSRTRSGPRRAPGSRPTSRPSRCRASTPRRASRCHREWERTLSEGRWSAVSWPEEYGGRGADYLHWLIFEEEYYRAGAPGRVNQNGIFLLGPTIMEVGTAEQKARFLPTMASSEIVWAQAWSEPNAGSDLAAIRSTGVLATTATSGSSTARRSGRRGRCGPTGASASSAPIPKPSATGPHLRARAARLARHHRAPDRAARRRDRLRRDLLRRRARAGREHARRGEPGLAGRDGHRRLRARRAACAARRASAPPPTAWSRCGASTPTRPTPRCATRSPTCGCRPRATGCTPT